jgi:phi13 family phage major tail protein
MSIDSGEYKSAVGLRDLYIAAVTVDSAAAYTAGTPEILAPAASANAAPNQSFEVQYADDGPFDVFASEGETVIDLEVTAIPLVTLAAISGKIWDATTGRMYDHGGAAGYYALGFRSLKSNGSYRYFWYLKGRFDTPSEEMATKGETAEPKLQKLKFTAIKTTHPFTLSGSVTDGAKRVVGDEDATNFDGTTWFSQVQVPGAVAPDALALSSSVPTDGATGIVVSANQTLTFNNALIDAAVYGVSLIDPSDGSVIAGAITLDAAKKIVTINPTASLTGATAYLLAYNVTDIYGQHLSGSVNFTTA